MQTIFVRLKLLLLVSFAIFLFASCDEENGQPSLIVQLSVDNPNFTGTCPHDFRFTGAVATDLATTITYFWERSTGNSEPASQTLTVPGQLVVTDAVRLEESGTATVRLHVTEPQDLVSQTITVTATCQPPPPTAL